MTKLRRWIVALAAAGILTEGSELSAGVLPGREPSVRQPSAVDAGVALKERGRRALQERRFRAAVDALEAAAAKLPNDIEVHLLLGRAYWGEDRPYEISAEKAVAALTRAVALDKTRSSAFGLEALQHLAVTCVRTERLAEARSAYVALAARVTDPALKDRYLTQIDEIDLDQGVYKPPPDAVFNKHGEVLAPIGPRRMRTNRWFEKGRHTQDPVKQEAYYRKATVTDPLMAQGWTNVGVALMNQGRCREALPWFQQAIGVALVATPGAPPYAKAHMWLMRCHLELGDIPGAEAQWRILEQTPPDNWTVLLGLRLQVVKGQARAAVPHLEAAAAEDPENVDVLHTLALAYAGAGQMGSAVALLERVIAVAPQGHPYLGHRLKQFTAQLTEWRTQVAAASRR